MDVAHLISAAVDDGDPRSLARLLSVLEDRRAGWREVASRAWTAGGHGHLIGLTGAPGAGKSSLANALVTAWRAVDRRVGVVAVDPSSPFSGGALLGDRIRMQDHVEDVGVFVRSVANRGRLGGVADATAAMTALLDAARFDPVVVETVGVGQAEVEVLDHVDTVVVVVTPGWGDSIQVEKAGVLEVADVLVVNKADRPGADEIEHLLSAMGETGARAGWTPPVIQTVATEDTGVEELLDALDRHRRHLAVTPEGPARRRRRALACLRGALVAEVPDRLTAIDVDAVVDGLATRRLDPWTEADQIP
jgi:LAO/AO transport system kinase